jgi:RecJ-like exonuclease
VDVNHLIRGNGEVMRCKYCDNETEQEYCPRCQKIRDAFKLEEDAEDRLIAFRKVTNIKEIEP